MNRGYFGGGRGGFVVEDMVALMLALPANRRREFMRRVRVAGQGGATGPVPLPRVGSVTRFPASSGQQAQWFLWRYSPRIGNVAFRYDVCGNLDVSVLRDAVNAIVRRHEILRTTYIQDEEVRQVVHSHRDRELPVQAVNSREDALRQAAVAAGAPFDLRRASPFRVRLWRYGPGRHLLLMAFHHIAVDEVSTRILEGELSEYYRQGLAGGPMSLPEVPLQYADYAVWQNTVDYGRRLAHWSDRLAGAAATELPGDRPRPPVPSMRGAAVGLEVPSGVRADLLRYAAEAGTTPFVVLLAMFVALLAEQAPTRDVLVGTPVAGRGHRGTERIVGYFLNTLALRVPVDPGAPFSTLVSRTVAVVADAFRNEVPFQEVVRTLGVTTGSGRNPLLDIMFSYIDGVGVGLTLPGLEVVREEPSSDASPFDLTVVAVDAETGLTVYFQYARDLYDAPRVRRWADRLGELLSTLARFVPACTTKPS
jgi:Condensation domain